MHFRKGSKRLLTPISCIYSAISMVKNLQHNFPKMRGGGQRPFRFFPKIHPIWRSHPSLTNMQDRRNIAKKTPGWSDPKSQSPVVALVLRLSNYLSGKFPGNKKLHPRLRETIEVRRYPACISVSHAAMSPRRTCSRTEANRIVGNPCPHFLRCDKLLG